MGNDQQQQIVVMKKVVDLEKIIEECEVDLEFLKCESFESIPCPPEKKKISREYPKVESTVKFHGGIVFAVFMALVAISVFAFERYSFGQNISILIAIAFPIIYYFAFYRPRKKANIRNIENSAEWKQKIADLTTAYDEAEKEAERVYKQEKKEYDEVILPAYKAALADWQKQHDAQVEKAQTTMAGASAELSALYDETKIVPTRYRSRDAVRFIYDLISSSTYDVTYAIEAYEKELQRQRDERTAYELAQQNAHLAEQNAHLAEQNALQEEANEEARKLRRDQNIAAATAAYQRHKTNKTLDSFKKK